MAQAQASFESLRQPMLREDAGATPRLPTEGNYPFRLMHHPQQVVCQPIQVGKEAVWYWLPDISPLPLKPGSNLVELGEGDGPVIDRALLALQKRGWVILDENEKWQGQALISKFPAMGGTFYCTVFDTPRKVAGKNEVRLVNDSDSDARWRHALVVAGKLPVPDVDAIDERMKQADKRLDRMAMKLNGNAQVQKKYQAWENQVNAMRSAIIPGADNDPLLAETRTEKPSKAVARA